MNELRWILIGCGIALLIGIYLWGRRGEQRTASADASGSRRPEPQVMPEPSRFDDDLHLEADDFDATPAAEVTLQPGSQDIEVPHRPEPIALPRSEFPAGTSVRERRGRIEPTFRDAAPSAGDDTGADEHETLTAELPVEEPLQAPTVSMSSTPPPRRIERRRIVSLRLVASAQRYTGESLNEAFAAESLQYGKYDVFHRMHAQASVFCIASMVEPGTFDVANMAGQTYPGITLFAQLPGPVSGVDALQDLVASGKRLQERLGGTLQDDRGVPLTVHRIEKLRQEVIEFERAQQRDPGQRISPQPSA